MDGLATSSVNVDLPDRGHHVATRAAHPLSPGRKSLAARRRGNQDRGGPDTDCKSATPLSRVVSKVLEQGAHRREPRGGIRRQPPHQKFPKESGDVSLLSWFT